ncbi:MAG: ribosome biogenesis GTPase Der, partial [Actinobacteria bacterium]|nr:ribosome biogenesis GTPase Der [Actinomycetota bacterium]
MNEEEFLAEPAAPEFIERLKTMSTDEEESRARVLRTGLEDYDLDDEDFDVLNAEAQDD